MNARSAEFRNPLRFESLLPADWQAVDVPSALARITQTSRRTARSAFPPLSMKADSLVRELNRKYLEGGMQLVMVELQALEQEAVQFVSDVSWRDDVAFKQTLEPGDAQFLNNYLVLPSRNEFEGWPDLEKQRLLFRLWLRVPGIRQFGAKERLMRDMPLIYGNQGRTPAETERPHRTHVEQGVACTRG